MIMYHNIGHVWDYFEITMLAEVFRLILHFSLVTLTLMKLDFLHIILLYLI